MMNETMKMDMYEPPKVEVVVVEVEQGFAGSGTPISGTVEEDDMGDTGGGMILW